MAELGDRDVPFGAEALLRHAPVGVVIASGPEGAEALLWNHRVEEIWGRRFEGDARPGEGHWVGFRRDGMRYAPEEWPLWRSIAVGERVEGEEISIVRADGSTGLVRVSSGPVTEEGQERGAIMVVADVTDRLRGELTRQILHQASAILASTLDYEETLRNVARLAVPTLADWCAVDLLLDDGEVQRLVVEHLDRRKKRVAEELSGSYRIEEGRGVAEALRTGRPTLISDPSEDDLLGRPASDRHRGLFRRLGLRSAMIAPLVARGRALGALVFVTGESGRRFNDSDLTLAEDLAVLAALAIDNARLYDDSQAANRAKADFLAVVSHELRTPLTAILGYAELLSLGIPDPITERQKEHVERIDVSAQHLLQVIEEILSVITLEAGSSRVRHAPVSCTELIRRAAVIAEPLARSKGLDLTVELPSPDVEMHTDGDKVAQALLNLLTNAVKFTERGGIQLGASFQDRMVEFRVSDTGLGMTEAQRSRIFDAFWQAEEPITRREGGAGLGLTITGRLVELLGGEIIVHSEPGEGSMFAMRFPLHPASPDTPDEVDH